MKDKILITEFLKDKSVGAIASSSDKLVKKMLKKIDFEEAKVIVEYGPGKGTITKQLLNNMKADAVLYVFETNEHFINNLIDINDRRLVIVNADAESALLVLKNRYKTKTVDYIVSTIPFSFLDRRKKRRVIFRTYSLLKEKGAFITAQYNPLLYGLIKNTFTNFSIRPNFANLPPAFVMMGVK